MNSFESSSYTCINIDNHLQRIQQEHKKTPPAAVQQAIEYLKQEKNQQIIDTVNGTIFLQLDDGCIVTRSFYDLNNTLDQLDSHSPLQSTVMDYFKNMKIVAKYQQSVRLRYCQHWNLTGEKKEAIRRAAYERAKKIMTLNNMTL